MTAPLEHRATLSHRRVMAAAMAARSRPIPVHWLSAALFVGLIAAVWLGHLVTFWGVQQLPFEWMFAIGSYLPTLIPALLAYLVVALVASAQDRVIRRGYLANFGRLGIPEEIEARFEVLPEGLRLTTDRITIFPRWEAVDTVERGGDGWVLSADHLTFLIPHDSFADDAAARAFVAAIVEHLPEAARERSADAVTFARSEAAVTSEPPAAPPSDPAGPLTARARITRQEASWAGRVGYDRIAHPGRHAFFYPALSALVGGMLGLVASGLVLMFAPLVITLANVMVFAGLSFLLPLVGAAVGLWLGYRALGRIFEKSYHAALAARGSPDEADCEWEIADEGFVTRSTRGVSTTRWEAISEVFRADAYWIVLSDLGVNVVPRRAFADEAAERTFIVSLVGKLSTPARDRSGEAAAFAQVP
jgi:hypothetical protein